MRYGLILILFVQLDGYAPFLSMTTRETFLDVGDSVMAAPGPGQYDPGIISERVKGGSTLANKVSQKYHTYSTVR